MPAVPRASPVLLSPYPVSTSTYTDSGLTAPISQSGLCDRATHLACVGLKAYVSCGAD